MPVVYVCLVSARNSDGEEFTTRMTDLYATAENALENAVRDLENLENFEDLELENILDLHRNADATKHTPVELDESAEFGGQGWTITLHVKKLPSMPVEL
jgi:hypothetical protein